MDIKGIVRNIELQRIYLIIIYGSVIVYDTQDIRTLLPSTGLERLSFKFDTPGTGTGFDMSEETGQMFQIYKIDKN